MRFWLVVEETQMNLLFRFLNLMIREKFRKRLKMWDTSRTPFRVMPSDLDVLGHMNNGKYLSLMDLGRVDLMVRSGFWKQLKELGWYPVVGAQTISYRRSLQPFVKFDLYSKVLGYSETGVYMEQTFCVGKTVYAKAYVRARFLKKSGGTVSLAELEAELTSIPENVSMRVPEWVEEWGVQSRQVPKEWTE